MSSTERDEVDFGRYPKQALVVALRNHMLGPSNISRQDKRDLIAIAQRAYETLPYEAASGLISSIEAEVAYLRSRPR